MKHPSRPVAGLPALGSLGKRAIGGLAWMLAQSVVARAISFGSQIALAAMLAPQDFGRIGLTYMVTITVSHLASFNVDGVLLRRQRALRLWSGTALWLNLLASLATALLLVAVAPLVARAYHTPGLQPLIDILAASIPLGCAANIANVMLRLQLRFKALAIWGTVELLGQTALTLLFARLGFGAFCFVIPAPIFAVIRVAVLWRMAGVRPRLDFRWRWWRHFFVRSASNSLATSINGLVGQGDYIILGFFATTAEVGIYYFAFRLAVQPLWLLAGNFTNALLPLFTLLNKEPQRQQAAVLNASTLLSFVMVPICVIVAAVAGPLVGWLFDAQWHDSVILIQLLSIGLSLDAVSWIAGSLLVTRGENNRLSRYLVVQALLFFVFVTVGAYVRQATGVAAAVLVYYAVTQPVFVYRVYRDLGATWRTIAWIYLVPLCNASASAALATLAADALLGPAASQPLRIVLVTGLAGSGYLLLTRLLAPQVWRDGERRIISMLERRTAPRSAREPSR